MDDQIIQTKKGRFGKIQVTIPMDTKSKMLEWHRKSGLGKAEFFRIALMIGVSNLAESVNAKSQDENYQPDILNDHQAIYPTCGGKSPGEVSEK